MARLSRFIFSLGVLAFLVQPMRAQRSPLMPAGSFGGYDFLLLNESVQKELKLTDEQSLKVKEVVHEIRHSHQEELEKLRTQAVGDRQTQLFEKFKAYSDETLKSVSPLLRPDQAKRLKQIKLQQAGFDAFADTEVLKLIDLTDAQKAQIQKIKEELNQKGRQALQAGPKTGFAEAMTKLTTLRRDALSKAVDVLSAEQKKTWKELTGDAFEIKFERPSQKQAPGQEKKSADGSKG